MTGKEFLAAVERDRVNGVEEKKRRELEAAEDARFDAISAEIDEHPICSPRSRHRYRS